MIGAVFVSLESKTEERLFRRQRASQQIKLTQQRPASELTDSALHAS